LRDDREEVYGTDRAGKWITSLKERGFYGEVAHFLHCVKTREKPMTDGMEAAKTQQLMEALVRVSGDELPF
jgi:virulence factor